MAKWKGTPVPNTGYVENVYFNTNLSVDEVVSLLSQLTYNVYDGSDSVHNLLCAGTNDSDLMSSEFIGTISINNSEDGYRITYAKMNMKTQDFEGVLIFDSEGWGTDFTGFIEINKYLFNSDGTFDVGLENDKLANLFSTTPFEEVQEQLTLNSFLTGIADAIRSKKGTTDKINASNFASEIAGISGGGSSAHIIKPGGLSGTAVPNTGFVEKIYFNKNLSIDEINSLIKDNFPPDTDWFLYDVVIGETSSLELAIVSAFIISKGAYSGYICGLLDNVNESIAPIFNTSVAELSAEFGVDPFVGWYSGLGEFIEFNDNVLVDENMNDIGIFNESLSIMFSSTPFETLPSETIILSGEYDGAPISVNIPNGYEEGTIVPNTGVVEKVYFNTNLSTTEVKNIMGSLTYNYHNVFEFVLGANASDNNSEINITLAYTQGFYVIMDNKGNSYFNTNPDTDFGFVGWNPEFNGVITINSEVLDVYDGISIGTQNDKITRLFSLTPFNPIIPEINIKSYIKEQKLPVQFNLNIDKTALIPKDYIVPEGVVEITENGTYDITKYESANINVTTIPEGYFKPEGTRNIIYNGTYDVNRYAKVNVNVDTLVPEGTADITTTEPVNVYYQAYAQVKEDNLIPENIKKNVSILGITGTLDTDDEIKRAEANFIENRGEMISDDYVNEHVYNIDRFAFAGCYSITTINDTNFPRCQSVDKYAFFECSKLSSVSFHDITWIGDYAFSKCEELFTIDFPKVTYIYEGAFAESYFIKNINLPLVKNISAKAFYLNTLMSSISLPYCIEIGEEAFAGNARLADIYLGGAEMVTLTNANTFFRSTNLTQAPINIHVRADLLNTYQADTVWAEAVSKGYIILVGDYTD